MLRTAVLRITAADESLVVGGLDSLSPERYALADQIVNAGIALGYAPSDVDIALRVAYIESRFDAGAVNGKSRSQTLQPTRESCEWLTEQKELFTLTRHGANG